MAELELFVDQFDPPSVEYSIFTYAVDPEVFEIVSVDVAAPPEQLPKACDPETVTVVGQSTVALFISLAVM